MAELARVKGLWRYREVLIWNVKNLPCRCRKDGHDGEHDRCNEGHKIEKRRGKQEFSCTETVLRAIGEP